MANAGSPNGLGTTEEIIIQQLSGDTDDTHRRHIIEADAIPIGEMNNRNKGNDIAEIGIKIFIFQSKKKDMEQSCFQC